MIYIASHKTLIPLNPQLQGLDGADQNSDLDLAKPGQNGSRPPTPRSEPRGETPQKQDCMSRGVTPHGLVTDSGSI